MTDTSNVSCVSDFLANNEYQQERQGMLKTAFLAINGFLPDAIVVLFAGNPCVLLKLQLISFASFAKGC